MRNSGASRREEAAACLNCSNVIACGKREAFAQRSVATKQSRLRLLRYGLLRWRSQ
jgi:hypothetical protein